MSFDLDIGYASECGPREINEDFVATRKPAPQDEGMGFICAIADGVAAGGDGRMAAQTSAKTLVEDYFGTPPTWDTSTALDRLIVAQNSWLAAYNRRHKGSAMSTLTALVLRGHTWTLAHVGDSRAYLLRAGQCRLLTQDHVLEHADFRSQLTRALGSDDAIRVDYLQGELQRDDCFVLITDGVHGKLADSRIAWLAGQGSAGLASNGLVAAALAAGGADNASALVIRVHSLASSRLDDALLNSRQLAPPKRLNVGDSIDGLTVTALLADTGVHVLYQVRDSVTRELRVLKTLHPSRVADPHERAMLAHEAWLCTRVTERRGGRADAGFVRLNEVPEASAFYLLYDWHPGHTLEQLMQGPGRKAIEVHAVVAWGIAAAQALGRLHRLGIVHRDVKPANLHLGDDGQLRLLDLGVALSGHESVEQRDLHAGTPSYMNPEAWDNAAADAQTDLFALGVTLYQLLTGHLPYGEIEPYQKQRYRRDPKPLSRLRPEVPIWLDHVVLKAVARERKLRFETAEELVLALQRGAARPLA
ncbi:MAG: bifunctional protein-serine/threonine kinase/phosphatase, partial [Burkholderiaceae bacterium]